MATSRVKTNLFLTFEIAAKWQNVSYTQRSYRLVSLNQPKIVFHWGGGSSRGYIAQGHADPKTFIFQGGGRGIHC